MESAFYTVEDVKTLLDVSDSKAYKVIQALNKELKSKGYITIAGKVPKKYFNEKYYC
ncbi:transcriptional regulator [Clostridium sp. 19966]|uniref:transcriptional regulator n=1 Tax=Clostridium sp. 19966 TaxID=2768166 RepID=UPI0028DDAC2A|nr:transcriptional regulator [Clostridium sp. 19966]MDT8715469.1 transcriptional regulator [Clostridium sp. 19966]